MTWFQFAENLFSGITLKQMDTLIWHCTCYPANNKRAAEQLEDYAKKYPNGTTTERLDIILKDADDNMSKALNEITEQPK